MKLSKIVFPVAGLGSRFLPATKATPKEMLPIVDKPLIQYAVEEAIDAGFTELIFVNAKSKVSIKEHFDRNLNLDISNLTKEKKELLNQTNQIIPNNVSCSYIIQDEPLGLGHAILLAKSVIKKDPFAVILADDLSAEELSGKNSSNILPPLYGALLKNEADVELFQKIAFMSRRES